MGRFGKIFTKVVDNNIGAIIVVAIAGIVMAVIGHYGTTGFDWKWFLFFELPLYVFVGWAFYNILKMLRTIKKHNDEKEDTFSRH